MRQVMDEKPFEAEQTVDALHVADKSCSESRTPIKKTHIHEILHDHDANLVSPTPEKTEATVNKFKKEHAELPEKQSMDQKLYEVEQTTNILPAGHKSCSESHTPIKKTHVHEVSHKDASLVSPTPEKTEATVNNKCKKDPSELPEKYRHLWEFFYRMTTSLRLLNLRKQLPTFENISRLVETLTGRKFSYKNLAQIKFILPEVVQTDKILLHNKKTLCMEPDIKVTLLFDDADDEHSDYMALCGLISSRLYKFVNAHSEDDDVPEAELPEPFNRRTIPVRASSSPKNPSIHPNVDETDPLIPSLLPPSFKRHFSLKGTENPMKTALVQQSPVSSSSIEEMDFTANPMETKLVQQSLVSSSSFEEAVFSTRLEKQEAALGGSNEDTPVRRQLVVNGINVETPDLLTPKRSVAAEDDKPESPVDQKVMVNGLVVKRSLYFSIVDEESVVLEGNCDSNSDSSAKVDHER